jgi:hypothetical protein
VTPGGAHVLRSVLIGADMTEDELLLGITEALTIAGWRWTHIRRSDGVTQGSSGLPDIIACHPTRPDVLIWELKSRTGQPTPDQAGWLAGVRGGRVDARLVRPVDYDDALSIILGDVPDTGAEERLRAALADVLRVFDAPFSTSPTTRANIRRRAERALSGGMERLSCSLTNPRLSEVDWDDVGALLGLRVATRLPGESPCVFTSGADGWMVCDVHGWSGPKSQRSRVLICPDANTVGNDE